MNKTVSIMLAVAFICATVGTCLFTDNLNKDLLKQLTDKERKVYGDIVKERTNIYLFGLVIGIVVSIIYIMFLNKTKSNLWLKLITGIAITMVINYFFYALYPKSKYMLEYLDTKNENIAWLKIYKGMKLRYHLAFLLGLIASGFFCYSFC